MLNRIRQRTQVVNYNGLRPVKAEHGRAGFPLCHEFRNVHKNLVSPISSGRPLSLVHHSHPCIEPLKKPVQLCGQDSFLPS